MSQPHKLSSFEGLRGLAAFVVLVSHLRQVFYAASTTDFRQQLAFLPAVLARPVSLLADGLSNGQFAVWLFWIMSGFVLSLQFFLRRGQTPATGAHDYLEDACLRRYPRLLLPVLASVLFAYALHACHLMRNVALADALGVTNGGLPVWYRFPASLPGALRSACWDTFFAYDGALTYNPALWTMEKELYGSFFLFAFLGLLGHRRSRLFAYPLVAAVAAVLRLLWLDSFVVGIMFCDLFANRTRFSPVPSLLRRPSVRFLRGSSPLAGLAWAVILMGAGWPTGSHALFLILGTGAVALMLVSTSTQRVLSSRVPMFLGRISFGLYLIHLPIVCSLTCGLYLATAARLGNIAAAWVSVVATCVVAVVSGYGLYRVADQPGIRLARWLARWIIRDRVPLGTAPRVDERNDAAEARPG